MPINELYLGVNGDEVTVAAAGDTLTPPCFNADDDEWRCDVAPAPWRDDAAAAAAAEEEKEEEEEVGDASK